MLVRTATARLSGRKPRTKQGLEARLLRKVEKEDRGIGIDVRYVPVHLSSWRERGVRKQPFYT